MGKPQREIEVEVSEKVKLKPCPFCGSVDLIVEMGIEYHIFCKKCTSCGPDGLTEPLAARWWNKRKGEQKDG